MRRGLERQLKYKHLNVKYKYLNVITEAFAVHLFDDNFYLYARV